MDSVVRKDDVVEMAKKLKINSAADGDSFLVYWDDDRFGVVARRDLVNIAVSVLTDDVHGKKCEAMYGEEKYKVTLMFRGKITRKLTKT